MWVNLHLLWRFLLRSLSFLIRGIMAAQSILDPARGAIDRGARSLHNDISVELQIHNTAQNMHTQCNIKEYAVEQLTQI